MKCYMVQPINLSIMEGYTLSKRILLEITPNPEVPGAFLEFLLDVAVLLGKAVEEELLHAYNIVLKEDVTWVIKAAAKAPKYIEATSGPKVMKDPALKRHCIG